jgi:hypothetical protein
MMKAASTTPGMVPDPPRMLTPPSTTIVTTSSSTPKAIDGRVEPRREVRQIEAIPAIRPVRQEQDELDAADAHAGEQCCRLVVADGIDRRPKFVLCSSTLVNNGEEQEQREFERDHPPDIALAEIGKARRIALV